MNKGSVLAVAIVAAYMGVEIFTFQKVSHRTKPDYIHNLLVETRIAIEVCNSDVSALSTRFDRTLARVSKRYTPVLHKISSPEAYRAVYKALHGVFTGLSLVTLSEI